MTCNELKEKLEGLMEEVRSVSSRVDSIVSEILETGLLGFTRDLEEGKEGLKDALIRFQKCKNWAEQCAE